jgi:ketosteroid isomerase-like protein
MSEESTTPDLVELVRRAYEASNHGDFNTMMSFYGRDAIWDMTPMGLGVYEGQVAIRRFFEEWVGSFEEFEIDPEEILDLGVGVTFAIVLQGGRPIGSAGHVELRYAQVTVWVDGLGVRTTNYTDINQARAAAERLVEERGQAMSENLGLVRSIYAAWGRGDYGSTEWAHPEIESVIVDGPTPGSWTGLAGLADAWREWLRAWDGYRSEADEFRELDEERVLVLFSGRGRGKASGAQIVMSGANLVHVRAGKVTRLALYSDRQRAYADLSLEE